MSAPLLRVFLSPVSVPGAGPEHQCWGADLHRFTHRGQYSQRRPWSGAALNPPGPMWPEVALSGTALRLPGPMQPEEALVGVGLRPGTHAARRGVGHGGAQAWDPCN